MGYHRHADPGVYLPDAPGCFFAISPGPPASRCSAQQGFLIEPKLLANVPEADQAQKAAELVNQRFKTHTTITRVEPVFDDSEGEVTGYMAYTKP